jgi:hypothetical protein
MKVIHIIEPTFEGESGHCQSFVESFCRAGRGTGYTMRVWAGKNAGRLDCPGTDVEIELHFSRRIRRIQSLLLYRRLLSEPGRIFLPTAGRTDLLLFDIASRGAIPYGKVFLFFHWFRITLKRLDSLRRMARAQPHVTIVGSTPSVAAPFIECGFENVAVAPIPIASPVGAISAEGSLFTHLLFAGAARQDKGFSRIVDLAALLAARKENIRMKVQVSPDHYEKHDAATKSDIERLCSIQYPDLCLVEQTLGKKEYRELFNGAICLQPYNRAEFADRASGVTLDALIAGCPIIVTSGTWMGLAVERFGAGKTVEDLSPERLFAAVSDVIADYPRYRRNAMEAGRVLLEENSARHLFAVVTA